MYDAYLLKPTDNGDMLAKNLQKRCDGSHGHVHLLHGLAKYAQEYPDRLRVAMVKGATREKIKAERERLSVHELERRARGAVMLDTRRFRGGGKMLTAGEA